MSYFKGAALGVLFGLSLGAQELPNGFSLKPKQEVYGSCSLKDLKGIEFPAVLKASRESDEDSLRFYVVQEHPTYKTPDLKVAYEYGRPRAVITVNGGKIDEVGDTVSIDGGVRFGGTGLPQNLAMTPEYTGFVSDVFRCFAGRN